MDKDVKIEELLSTFRQFKRHMHRQMATHIDADISGAQAEILIVIGRGMDRLRDVAEALDITPSAATQQLKLLQLSHLVESVESPEDRRENLLSLTRKGRIFLRHYRSMVKQHVRHSVHRLTDEEIEQFILIMNKMMNKDCERDL